MKNEMREAIQEAADTHTDEGLRTAIALRREHPDIGALVFSQYVVTRYASQLLAEGSAGVG
jgi:hypothetical protein